MTRALVVVLAALVLAPAAFAHANISPPVALAKTDQLFTLVVPTEKESATTTQVELTPPAGFNIDSFVAAPGWTRSVQQNGLSEESTITKVTWKGGKVGAGDDAAFSFVGGSTVATPLTFGVRQTYSDGSVVDWSGAAGSDNPAPSVDFRSSLGGGGSSTLAVVAIVIAGIAFVVAVGGLVARSGGRPLA